MQSEAIIGAGLMILAIIGATVILLAMSMGLGIAFDNLVKEIKEYKEWRKRK